MSIQVIVFDERKAEVELKKCPKIVRDHVFKIKEHWDRQKKITNNAINKLRELTKELNEYKTREVQDNVVKEGKLDKATFIIRSMFSHFSAQKSDLKHYEGREEFIETFAPVIKSLNDAYSHIVEDRHILSYDFKLIATVHFKNYIKSFIDDNNNMIEFNFKNRTMKITNADNDEFILLGKSSIPNLLTFEAIMNALGFICL